MNGSDPVRAMRADDRHVGHANFGIGTLLDQAYAGDSSFLSWKTIANLVKQTLIDLDNDV